MPREANIIVARCEMMSKDFGIRFEKTSSNLREPTWSFKIPSNQEIHEDCNKSGKALTGPFRLHHYPGCPYCKAKSLVHCSCGMMYYSDENRKERMSTCPWCRKTAEVMTVPPDQFPNRSYNMKPDINTP